MGNLKCLRYFSKIGTKRQVYTDNNVLWPTESAWSHRTVCSSQRNWFLRGLIYEKAEKLESSGHYIAIRWIPSHSGAVGNENADLAARNKAERGGRQVERWSSLAHIRKKLTEARSQELAKWHEVKTQERDISRRGYYVPWTKGGINTTLANAPKKICIAVLLAESRTWRGRDFSSKNKSYRDTRMLVMRRNRAIRWTTVCQLPKMEERKKEIS